MFQEKLEISELTGWYNVEISDITSNGGIGLMELYGNSVSRAVMTVYSEYDWKPGLFNRKPK